MRSDVRRSTKPREIMVFDSCKMSDADLIECVQQFDVVWNKKNPNYKNKLVVKNSWNAIGEALNLSAEVCEQRFANIRHRYAKERRTLLDNTHSGAGAYVSKWPHFEACSFLNNVIATRATRTNFQKATSTDSSANNLRVSATAKFSMRSCETREAASKCSNEATMDVMPEDALQSKYDKVISVPNTENTFLDVDLDDSELTLHDVFLMRHSGNYETESRSTSRMSSASQATSTSQHTEHKKRNSKGADQDLIELTNTISGTFNKFENLMKSSQQCDELPAELSDEDFAFGRTVALALKNISSNKKKLILKAKILNDIANATDD
ncbi:uncharacterized protein [Linepithema humile]|uniref:uncharacterized protein n=1 Tax=Linepithema humile TaxID=83485 RepID=UPI00351E6B1A